LKFRIVDTLIVKRLLAGPHSARRNILACCALVLAMTAFSTSAVPQQVAQPASQSPSSLAPNRPPRASNFQLANPAIEVRVERQGLDIKTREGYYAGQVPAAQIQ